MSKQKQLLPRVPYIGTMELFDTNSITIYYDEWSRTPKSYQPKNVDCATQEEANQVVEYLKCVRILEPLFRFLTGQEQALRHDFGNSIRKIKVGQCKKDLQTLLKPANQTTAHIAEYFFNGGGKLFSEAVTSKKDAVSYTRGQDLLAEIREFTRQHLPAYNQTKSVAA